jgi:hypothetical protein
MTRSMFTCSNLAEGGAKDPMGADTCRETLEPWQSRQALSHLLQSALMDGHTKR